MKKQRKEKIRRVAKIVSGIIMGLSLLIGAGAVGTLEFEELDGTVAKEIVDREAFKAIASTVVSIVSLAICCICDAAEQEEQNEQI